MEYRVPIARSNQIVFVSIWILFVVGIYLGFSPNVGGVVLPSVIVLVLFPFLVICSYKEPWSVGRRDAVFIAIVVTGIFVMMVMSPGREFLVQKSFGLIQFMVALASLVTFVSLSRKIPALTRDRMLFFLWTFILVGCFLEVTGVIKGLSDGFRNFLYSDASTMAYSNDIRDIGLVGFPRPKLFTAEPSYVAQMFTICINAWYLMRPTNRRFGSVVAATMIMYVFMASPKLFVSLGLTIFIFATQMKGSEFSVKRALQTALVVVLLLLVLTPQMYDVFYNNIYLALTNIDLDLNSSLNVRVVFPFVTAFDVLSQSPWIGAGIGGKEVIEEMMTLPVEVRRAIGGNGFARSLMFFGIVGTIFLFTSFILYLKKTDVNSKWCAAAAFGAVFVMGGGLETIYSWGFIAIFMSACLPQVEGK